MRASSLLLAECSFLIAEALFSNASHAALVVHGQPCPTANCHVACDAEGNGYVRLFLWLERVARQQTHEVPI